MPASTAGLWVSWCRERPAIPVRASVRAELSGIARGGRTVLCIAGHADGVSGVVSCDAGIDHTGVWLAIWGELVPGRSCEVRRMTSEQGEGLCSIITDAIGVRDGNGLRLPVRTSIVTIGVVPLEDR
jgi:hypothetical protein